MKSPLYMVLHLPDLARDLAGLPSHKDRGIYITLLVAYCARCEPFAIEDKGAICSLGNLTPQQWRFFRPQFERLFTLQPDGKWHHLGLDRSLEHAENVSAVRQAAGRKGNEKQAHLRAHLRAHLPSHLPSHLRPETVAIASPNGSLIPNPNLYPETSKTPTPRPRASRRPKVEKKIEAVFGADPSARNGHATTERSSTPGFKQVRPSHVTPATANLMSQCARFVGEDKAAQFWADMMGDNAAIVLSNTAKAMRDSGWKDSGQ